jgi:raffinose/stachyose/melibiose transport system permease protein
MMFLAGLLTIPDDLLEAARVDGANAWQSFLAHQAAAARPGDRHRGDPDLRGQCQRLRHRLRHGRRARRPKYATDLLGTFFYRTAIAGEHPVARPDMGIGAAVATATFVILLAGVSLWLILQRRRSYEL